jgi:hypothetical protein
LVIAGAMFSRRRISFTHLLLILFSLYAGLLAVRNIPIAAIILSFVLGPVLAAAFSTAPNHGSCPGWLRGIIAAEQSISGNMAGLERQFRGHVWATVATIASTALVLNGGRVFSHQVMASQFDKKILPIEAAEFIAQKGIRDHLFSTDSWGSYLIYRLYPEFKVYFDDRHDFYGEGFVKECAKAYQGTRQWREPLDRYQVQWVLMPPDSALSSLLREERGWHVEYDDGLAILFARTHERRLQ